MRGLREEPSIVVALGGPSSYPLAALAIATLWNLRAPRAAKSRIVQRQLHMERLACGKTSRMRQNAEQQRSKEQKLNRVSLLLLPIRRLRRAESANICSFRFQVRVAKASGSTASSNELSKQKACGLKSRPMCHD